MACQPAERAPFMVAAPLAVAIFGYVKDFLCLISGPTAPTDPGGLLGGAARANTAKHTVANKGRWRQRCSCCVSSMVSLREVTASTQCLFVCTGIVKLTKAIEQRAIR